MTELIPILDPDADDPVGLPHFEDFHAPLSEGEARAITDTICNAMDVVWMLIARAHAGRAWEALGYDTWSDYVGAEFNMSRSRSYQLLDQARVVGAIEAAVPEGTVVSITEAAARDLKGVLEEVVPEIRERTAGLDPDEASDLLAEIVEEQRERLREEREADIIDGDVLDEGEGYGGTGNYSGNGGNGPGGGNYFEDEAEPIYDDLDSLDVTAIRQTVNATHDLYAAVPALASLPADLTDVINLIPRERYAQIDDNLEKAQVNLTKFAKMWNEHRAAENEADGDFDLEFDSDLDD